MRVTYPQRIALSVLAEGGYIKPGIPGRRCPDLIRADGCWFSLIQRQGLSALIARGWVGETANRYEITHNGRLMAARYKL